MSVRLIAGRAGSGKTWWCQRRICDALDADLVEGPRLIFLVPEQAAHQMERSLLLMSGRRTLGRCEVLSFRRLARRILDEVPGRLPAVMSPLGRQMALRHLIYRHRSRLREFAAVAQRPGFIRSLSDAVVELFQEAVSVDQLERATARAEANRDPGSARLHDVSLLFRAYLDYLGADRVDPEGVLDLARDRLEKAGWLAGSRVWIDGFAGLTRQQERMIVALAQRAADVDVALLLDPTRARSAGADQDSEDYSIFARTERTWRRLSAALREAGVGLEPPEILGAESCPRFAGAADLAWLETRVAKGFVRAEGAGHSACTAIRLVEAEHMRMEVAAAAREIADLVRRPDSPMRYRDIAVVVRDLSAYHDLISSVLGACNIPFFIDRRRPTHHHPLVQFLRALLLVTDEKSVGQAVVAMLKSGLSGLPDDSADMLENYILAHGLYSSAAWEEPWTYPAGPLREDDERARRSNDAALAAIVEVRDALRARFGEWWPGTATRTGRPAVRTWVERLGAAMKRFNLRAVIGQWCDSAAARGDLDEAEEHEQVWSDCVRLLDELVGTLGDERMTARELRDVIEAALADFTLGLVPPTVDQVLVGSIERSRHPPVRCVFLLGLADDMFPLRAGEESILGDDERGLLGAAGVELSRNRDSRLADEHFLAYVALTRSSERLWVSRPLSDERGRALGPSPYWTFLRSVLPADVLHTMDSGALDAAVTRTELAGMLALEARRWAEQLPVGDAGTHRRPVDPVFSALYEWARRDDEMRPALAAAVAALREGPAAKLSEATIRSLWPEPHRTSVTRLEQFARCPFQHFAAQGLRLEPRARHEITSINLGELYHRILEEFVEGISAAGVNLRDLSAAQIAERLSHICGTVLPRYAETVRLEAAEQRKVYWRSRGELSAALRGHRSVLGRSPLSPLRTEQVFGERDASSLPPLVVRTPSGRMVHIRGKIDRVDVLSVGGQTLAVVYDYKRSLGVRLRLDEVFHGLALQLFTYLLVLRDHPDRIAEGPLTPAGAFYLPLLAGFERVDHPDDAADEGFDPLRRFGPRGVVDFDWIDRLDPSHAEGWSGVFSVYRTKEGRPGHLDNSDAVEAGALPRLLEHVRGKLGELADRWLAGEIAVQPVQLGTELPCTHCLYRSVCRVEFVTRPWRRLPSMSRKEVLDTVAGRGAKRDA